MGDLFARDQASMTYSHLDRAVVGGAVPAGGPFPLCSSKLIGAEANRVDLGSQSQENQLVMGITTLADGSVWNTMPCHTHDRRSEIYLYFGMEPDTRAFHFMGEPDETRHLVVANEEAVLSPGWSIHCGAATRRYSFIWAMGGDNQDFGDMDMVEMETLR